MKGTKKQLLALAVATGLAVAGTSGAAVVEAPASAEVAYLLAASYGLPFGRSVTIGGTVGGFMCGRRCALIGAR